MAFSDEDSSPADLCFLLTGLARSGKSTIDRIVFQENGHERRGAFMTEGRSIRLKVIDLPDPSVILEPRSPFPYDETLLLGCHSVVFVVDITDDYVNALTKLCALCMRVSLGGGSLPVEVLLHKADSMEEMERQDVLKDVTQKVREQLAEICPDPPTIYFHLTSIFDHSLYICLSRIIQKHLPEGSALEALLDNLCSNSRIEKAFLFDTERRIFLATDSSPVGICSFELASETLDMVCDLQSLYRHPPRRKVSEHEGNGGGRKKEREKERGETAAVLRGRMRLSNGIVVGNMRVNRLLSLVYLLNAEGHPVQDRPESIALNVNYTCDAIRRLLSV